MDRMDVEMSCAETNSNSIAQPNPGGTTETKQKLLARLGLENEAKLKEMTAGSSRKERYVEKMMVAELHHMRGELTVERSSLLNENASLKKAIRELKARQQATMITTDSTMTDCSSGQGTALSSTTPSA